MNTNEATFTQGSNSQHTNPIRNCLTYTKFEACSVNPGFGYMGLELIPIAHLRGIAKSRHVYLGFRVQLGPNTIEDRLVIRHEVQILLS